MTQTQTTNMTNQHSSCHIRKSQAYNGKQQAKYYAICKVCAKHQLLLRMHRRRASQKQPNEQIPT